jgi:hypothetical protein
MCHFLYFNLVCAKVYFPLNSLKILPIGSIPHIHEVPDMSTVENVFPPSTSTFPQYVHWKNTYNYFRRNSINLKG